MRCKCASSIRVACVVFSSFVTCCNIASERASRIVSRYPRSARSGFLPPPLPPDARLALSVFRTFFSAAEGPVLGLGGGHAARRRRGGGGGGSGVLQQQQQQECQCQRQWQCARTHSGEEGRKEYRFGVREGEAQGEGEGQGERARGRRRGGWAAENRACSGNTRRCGGGGCEGEGRGSQGGEAEGQREGEREGGWSGQRGLQDRRSAGSPEVRAGEDDSLRALQREHAIHERHVGVIHVPCVVFCMPPTMLPEAFAALCA